MKTVLLLRHAKSSWDQPHLPDPQRPLAPRGRKAAPRMGAFMVNAGLLPDRVLCSTARRAVETWNLVVEQFDGSREVEFRDDLYHASAWSLLPILQGLPNSENVVLLVGHNPTFEDLALTLAGAGAPECLAEMNRKYPTGALAVIDFSIGGWQELRAGEGFLRDFVRPRTLKP